MTPFDPGTWQKGGAYHAFIPATLPRAYQLDITLMRLHSDAERALAALDAHTDPAVDLRSFLTLSTAQEGASSTRIEGTRTEAAEVLRPAERIAPERRDDWEETRNYLDALSFAQAEMARIPLSLRLLGSTHEILLAGVRGQRKAPGAFRRVQNWIGGSSPEGAAFVPPPPDRVPELMADLEKFLHDDVEMPELVRIALVHYQLETIHPYLDGNGRLGRLLILLQMIHAGLLREPALALSTYFERHRAAYYDALSAGRAGRIEEWLGFFFSGVTETARRARSSLLRVRELRTTYEERLAAVHPRRRVTVRRLVEALFSRPTVSTGEVRDILGVSFQTASDVLAELVTLGVLRETTGRRRSRAFEMAEYLEIFRSGELVSKP